MLINLEIKSIENYSYIIIINIIMSHEMVIKSILVGDTCVGKTCIVDRLVKDDFKDSTAVTIGVEFNVKYFEVDGQVIKLQLWDTAGQEIFRSITLNYFRNAVIAFLVFDLTKKHTFDNCKYWIDTIREKSGEDTFICLIGNKNDLVSNICIDRADIDDLVYTENILYHEVSAKNNYRISETFRTAVIEMYCKILKNKSGLYTNHEGITYNNVKPYSAISIHRDSIKKHNKRQNQCCDI